MRQGVSQYAEKRLFVVLLVQPLQCFLMNHVGRVLRTFLVVGTIHRILDVFIHHHPHHSGVAQRFTITVQEIGVVEMSLKLTDVTVVFIYSPFVGSRTRAFISSRPFAEHTRGIAIVFHYFRQDYMVGIIRMLSYYRIFLVLPIQHDRYIFPVFFVASHLTVA